MKRLRVRGFNINYYILARFHYVNIIGVIISVVFIGGEFLILSGEGLSYLFFQSFDNFIAIFIGFFLCLVSTMYLGLLLISIVRNFWVVVSMLMGYLIVTVILNG